MGKVFDNFDPNAIVKYNGAKIEELMQDVGIIRHRAKIEAVVRNAGAYSEVKKTHGSLDNFLWSYVNYQPITTEQFKTITRNELSDKLAKDLKKLGHNLLIYAGCRNDKRSRAKLFNEK